MDQPHAFKFRTPRDLLEKAEREFLRYRSDNSPHPENPLTKADHAFNFVVTAWHLVDWVYKYDANRGFQIADALRVPERTSGRFKEAICSHDESGALALCRELANGAKHFGLDRDRTSRIEAPTTTSTGALSIAGVDAPRKFWVQGTLDNWRDAESVFGDCLEFWRRFFQRYGVE